MCIYIEFLDKYPDKVQLVIAYAKLFGFPIFRLWAYPMKIIPETRRAHYVWYLRFYIHKLSRSYITTIKCQPRYKCCASVMIVLKHKLF